MQYYAKTYTADPKTGLLTPGEFLTEAKVAALGEDRIANMVERGVLAVTSGTPALTGEAATSEKPAVKNADKKAEKANEVANAEPAEDEEEDAGEGMEPEGEDGGNELPELDTEDGTDMSGEDGGDELPELDAADAIDAEDTPVKPAKKGGRRKTK